MKICTDEQTDINVYKFYLKILFSIYGDGSDIMGYGSMQHLPFIILDNFNLLTATLLVIMNVGKLFCKGLLSMYDD